MKKLLKLVFLINLIFLLIGTNSVFADPASKYYVLIKNIDDGGDPFSTFVIGDIVNIMKWKETQPSDWGRSMLENYLILVMNLTDNQKAELLEMEYVMDGDDIIITYERKRSIIDVSYLEDLEDFTEVNNVTGFLARLGIKH